MNHLKADILNLNNMFEHISEFVRIDEHLRLKLKSLESVTPESIGWTYQAGIEVEDHKDMINCIRCFLHFQARERWGESAHMFSTTEYQTIKQHKTTTYAFYKDMPGYCSVTTDVQLGFLMGAIKDKDATMDFYKALLSIIYKNEDGRFFTGMEKNQIISNILSKCVFELP